MSIKDALLATIGLKEGGIKGRTLLQKKMYFLGVLVDEEFLFSPHYYGPYSSTVADELGALCEAELVSEQAESLPEIVGPFGSLRRFVYRLTDSGKEVAQQRKKAVAAYNEAQEQLDSHAVVESTVLLSSAAKVHYILSEHGIATVSEIRSLAEEHGWNLRPHQMDDVVSFLEQVGLVEESC